MSLDLDTLSFLLLGSISTVALLSIRNAKGPDVHPLLLNAQADPSRLRHVGETAIYRSRMHPNGSPLMLTMDRNIRTLHDLFELGGAKSNLNAKFLGNFNGSAVVWQTYDEVKRRVDNFRCGLATFASLTPKTNDASSFVGVFAKSSSETFIAEQAANSHSYVTIPIAASARTTFISHILSTTSLTTVVVDKETLPILLSVAEGTSVKYVIVDGTPSHAELASANEKNIKLEEFKNVEAIGAAHPTSPVVPEPEDICSIYFTKASGKKAGVVLKHKNILANIASYIAIMPPNQKVTAADRLIYSYPLGNVLSRVLTGMLSYVGGSIAYGCEIAEDEEVVDITRLQTCAQQAMPTIIASGSLAFTQIKDRIESHYGNSFLYKRGYEAKKRTLLNEGRLVVDNRYDMLVFRDIRQKTFGGSLRLVLFDNNGDLGDLPTFVRVVLGAQAVPTYSRTEASGTITASMFFDYAANPASRGSPTPCNEVKLIDLPEGYLATDTPNPRGEICVRGNNVFSGYWGDSNTTSEVLDGDKWFMTGDIGEWLPNGTLKIVGSKK
ncbi:hypothetical protein K450DRAFT_234521 [Umbelopsis ramanniana AG]|uniref:AMP-dependent synthetase/ligase domain-containing protein n=1 Tax=Umbelopsis ramanniana AG TaxID=1314678 RepID=A0AAD5ECB8_UMBRA|nr:uncharacterized protein K450DRAFT_234521 [Umbelopsis ramanniana AG]KAI8581078.1 hypothetical protein K450DRAFT_234521 [Umbelopsis ramanniana AG]